MILFWRRKSTSCLKSYANDLVCERFRRAESPSEYSAIIRRDFRAFLRRLTVCLKRDKMSAHRRNPLRLIINKEIQLRILWIVGGSVFLCMTFAVVLWSSGSPWLWNVVLMLAVGVFVSLWASRRVAGPLYRIEQDLEAFLSGALERGTIQLREGDPMGRLAELLNKLMEKSRKR